MVALVPRHLHAALLLGLAALAPAFAADPPSGTLSPDNPELTYGAGPFVISNQTGVCIDPVQPCDEFALTLDLPADYTTTHPDAKVDIEVLWDNTSEDFDLYALEGGEELASDGSFAGGREFVSFPAGAGQREIVSRVIPFLVAGGSFTARITLVPGNAVGGGGGTPPAPSNARPGGPRLDVYRPPAEFTGLRAAEPTLDVNMSNDNVFMLFTTVTTKTTFDDTYSPALTTWTDVSDPTSEPAGTADPILVGDYAYDAEGYPDPTEPTRLFVVQLQLANSIISATDDEGGLWVTSQGGGQPHGVDNQSLAAGPYALLPATAYRHAVYYCSHSIVNAFCSRSDNGGLAFNPSVPIFQDVDQTISLACNNHGHVKVGVDGTVYVPQETCDDASGVVVSEDDGMTWEYRPIEGASAGQSDTSAAIARDGTLYMGYANGADGRPWVAVSKDRGRTWVQNQPIDGTLGLKNTVWVECVAGDPDRAACAFHGTTEPGDANVGGFAGVWYTYLAITYDGGSSWQYQEVTPGDPVQKGGICLNGLGCPSSPPNRNLLDFFDVVLDSQGRVIIGYADGCIGICRRPDGPPTYSASGVIARQAGGKTLFAKFDPPAPTAPRAPLIEGRRTQRDIEIRWIAPYDGESPITGYTVYRGLAAGALSEHAQTTKPFFADHDVDADATYHYQVVAHNAVGSSARSNEIAPRIGDGVEVSELPCMLPGLVLVDDAAGDTAAPAPGTDIDFLAMAEPFTLDGKLVFTLKVDDLTSVPSGLRWAVRFQAPTAPPEGQDDWFVSMTTQDSATPRFVYGTTGVISDPAVGLVGARLFTEIGELDPASAYSADGTIVLVLDKAAIGSPAAGAYLTGVAGSVRTVVTPQNNGIVDDTGDGQFYQLVGNAACDLDNMPLAILNATPTSGAAPLRVVFDGRQSSSPDGSAIVSYLIDFNDGSPVVEDEDGVVEHVYESEGFYRATMTVRDASGRTSANFAEAQVVVGGAVAALGGVMDEDRFGGGLPLATLLGLAALAALRRRLRPGR